MADIWAIADHVCQGCLGRVLMRHAGDGTTVVRCSNCGREAAGEPSAICACGIRRGKYDRLRCVRLDRHMPGISAEVVVVETDDAPPGAH